MGRAEDRKRNKYINTRLTKEQFEVFRSDINKKYIENEVKLEVDKFISFYTECMLESLENNGINKTKTILILEDVNVIMKRKMGEKRNGKS